MERKDIEHLAHLARINLTPSETASLTTDMTNILSYVSDIEKVVGNQSTEKKVGPLYNVMRADENPHPGGLYTEDLLNLAPHREGQYIKVKKILEGK